MPGQSFIHLHTHSSYSIGEGVVSPARLVRRASELNMSALALTDRNTLAGVPHFLRAAKELGLKPIIGCELDFLATDAQRATNGVAHSLVLLAENEEGYRNLVRLVTLTQKRSHQRSNATLTLDDLSDFTQGLIALTSGSRGELFELLCGEDVDAAERFLARLLSLFGERLFLEMVLVRDGRSALVNAKISKLSKLTKIQSIATKDVYYLSPQDELCARFLKGKEFDRRLLEEQGGDEVRAGYCASARDLFREYPHYAEEIEATAALAARCNFALWEGRDYFPHRSFSRGQDAESVLWDIVTHRISERDAASGAQEDGMSADIKERLSKEFEAVKNERFADALLFLADTAHHLSQRNTLYALGDENLMASFIAHVLGIVEIDPVKYRLVFESFRPDSARKLVFSLRVPSRCVEGVIACWRELLGEDCVAEIGRQVRHSVMDLRAGVTRWLAEGKRADDSLASHSSLLDAFLRILQDCPKAIRPKPRVYVLCGTSLQDVCPVQESADGAPMTEYALDDLAALGVPVVEIVPDRLLDLVDHTLCTVGEPDAKKSPPSASEVVADAALYQAMSKGEVRGVPIFEAPTVRGYLRQHKPKSILALIKVLGDAMRGGGRGDADRHTASGEPSVIALLQMSVNALRVLKVKLEHPSAFFVALLSSLRRGSRLFGSVLAEIRQNRIPLLPADSNFSLFDVSLEERGIRTGLRMVKGVSRAVYGEIEQTRVSGAFNDPEDFMARIDRSIVTPAVVRNLIKAGAFDSAGENRQDLLRQHDARHAPYTCIFLGKSSEEAHSSALALANAESEREAMGCVLSADVMMLHRDALRRMKIGYGTKTLRKPAGTMLWASGFVGTIDKRGAFIKDDVRLVAEVSGVVVLVPPEVFQRDRRIICGSRPIIVGGKAQSIGGELLLIAAGFWDLVQAADEARDIEKIVIDLRGRDAECVSQLRRMLSQYPGRTVIEVTNYEEEAVRHVERLEERKVFWCPPLAEEIKTLLPREALHIAKRVA